MDSRRGFLALLGTGVAATAGCTSISSDPENGSSVENNTNESSSRTSTEESNTIESETNESDDTADDVDDDDSDVEESGLEMPLDGLGALEPKVKDADWEVVHEYLDEDDYHDPEALADKLSDHIALNDVYGMLQQLYKKQNESSVYSVEDTIVANVNLSYTSGVEEIIEIRRIEDRELKGSPIIVDVENNSVYMKHKPGQEGPDYLKRIRDPEDWARFVPQNYRAIRQIAINDVEEKGEQAFTKEDIREFRRHYLNEWSRIMFGANENPDLIPKDFETAVTAFEALYGNANTQIIADLSNEYYKTDYDTDTLVTAEYDGEWNFESPDDRNMGDRLEGEEEIIS